MENMRCIKQKSKKWLKNSEHPSPLGFLPAMIKLKIFDNFTLNQEKKLRLICPGCRPILMDKTCYCPDRVKKPRNGFRNSERRSSFRTLPVEIKTKIFDMLSFSQRKQLRLVCPSWRAIVSNKMKFTVALNNETLPLFQKSCCRYESLCFQNLTEDITEWKPFVGELSLGRGNSPQNVIKFLSQFCTQTESLVLKNLCLEQIPPVRVLRMLPRMHGLYLETFSVKMGTKKADLNVAQQAAHSNHIDSVMTILRSVHFENLTNLTIDLEYDNEDTSLRFSAYKFDYKKSLLDVLAFILRHKDSLKKLHLTLLGKPAFDERLFTSKLVLELPKLQLQTFSIKFDPTNEKTASFLISSLAKESRSIVKTRTSTARKHVHTC